LNQPCLRYALDLEQASGQIYMMDQSQSIGFLYILNLARILHDANRLKEAEGLYRRALEIDQKTYGLDHPKVAAVLSNLAQLLHEANRLEEAEPLMRRTLAIDEESFGPDHPDVAR
jgi:tetratricopeptide (TPR) repeat protein